MRAAQAAVSAATDTLYGCFALQRYSIRFTGNAPVIKSHHIWRLVSKVTYKQSGDAAALTRIDWDIFGEISQRLCMTYDGGPVQSSNIDWFWHLQKHLG